MSDRIELIPIKNLIGKKFCIPNYQRGYRWGRQQVRDLLDDIAEYMNSSCDVQDEFYCLQPLVVCERVDNNEDFLAALPKEPENALPITRDAIAKHVEWEVIDGQQRLTTIHILLSVLDSRQELEAKFSIRYATREGSQSFLEGIAKKNEEDSLNDIDFWHMFEAYKEIQDWFEKSKGRWSEDLFKEVLLNKVQFIWYESNEDSIKVFTRLNIGKIGLTNSELIKALMLNRSNFEGQDADKIRLRQLEIAVKWDEIESVLQDDEFWMFLHDKGFDKPTRIDFLFDLVCELKMLDRYIDESALKDKDGLLGKDGYRTFRYFNAYFKSEKAKCECDKVMKSLIEVCWEKVDEIFATFREWFEDLRLYHYVGFLVDQKSKIGDIYKVWKEQKLVLSEGKEGEKAIDIRTKEAFLKDYLIPEIKTKVSGCNNLEKQYETGKSEDVKQRCRSLLLLHNIQTVINQNDRQSADGHSGVFYKFPFHLYKTEGWDIEHIDSNSENGFDEWDAKVEFLANHYNAVEENLQSKIIDFCSDPSKATADNFTELRSSIEDVLGKCANGDRLNPEEKNKVWNFALLDSSTNRSYGNSIFSAKRRIIIGKDKGKYIPVPSVITKKGYKCIDVTSEEVDAPSSFIPPCTRQVFLKYYSAIVASPNYWLKTDAENYKKDIFTTLKMFGVVMNDRNAKEA